MVKTSLGHFVVYLSQSKYACMGGEMIIEWSVSNLATIGGDMPTFSLSVVALSS